MKTTLWDHQPQWQMHLEPGSGLRVYSHSFAHSIGLSSSFDPIFLDDLIENEGLAHEYFPEQDAMLLAAEVQDKACPEMNCQDEWGVALRLTELP